MKRTSLKAEKGLIEVELMISEDKITSIKITGDFFIHPEEAIEDFESALTDIKIDEVIIREKITQFYETKKISTPGITIDNWINVLFKAINS